MRTADDRSGARKTRRFGAKIADVNSKNDNDSRVPRVTTTSARDDGRDASPASEENERTPRCRLGPRSSRSTRSVRARSRVVFRRRARPRGGPPFIRPPRRAFRGDVARARAAPAARTRARVVPSRIVREKTIAFARRARSLVRSASSARARRRDARALVGRGDARETESEDRFEPRVVAPFPSSRAARRVRTRRVRLPDARASPPLLSLSQTSARPRRSASGTSIRTGSRCARPLSNHLNVRRPRHVVATRAFLSGGG